MKRITSLFLVLVMLFSLTAIAFAQGIIPTPDVTTVKKGEQVTVTMTMEETITGVTTAEFRLAYDENLFEFNFDSSTPGECDIAKSGGAGGQVWNGYVKYTYSYTRAAGGTLNAGAVLATLVFTAKADVTAEQTATFTSSVYTFAKADGTHPVSDFLNKTVSVTVTPASTEPEGYAVAASAVNPSITVNDDAQVALKISNTAVTTYNAYYMEVSYDAAKLTYKSVTPADATIIKDETNGTLKIAGYGADKTCGTDNIVLTFTGKATGAATVTVISAKVDVKANAAEKDAPAATLLTKEATITVGGYQVTLPDGFTADSMVANPGEDYTFTANDVSKKYDFTGSTMGGETVNVIDKGNGTYTVENVTGPLVITATALVKINLDNQAGAAIDGITNGEYVKPNTEINFTATSDAGKELVVTVDGEEITGMNQQGMYSYTIAADKVTGTELNIVVSYKAADKATIIESGTAWDKVGSLSRKGWTQSGDKVDAGATLDFFFKPETGKTIDDYVIRANDVNCTYAKVGGRYKVTIPAEIITAGATVTINFDYAATPEPTITVNVSEYLKLDGQSIFLITATGEVADGKVLAYDKNPMYWSSKYGESGAYAWLVIADGTKNLDELKTEATAAITAVNGTKVEIVYGGDVNLTNAADINDAQLVWNMYNAEYKADTDFQTVNRLKYLSADINGNKTVDTSDAAAIVNTIVGSN